MSGTNGPDSRVACRVYDAGARFRAYTQYLLMLVSEMQSPGRADPALLTKQIDDFAHQPADRHTDDTIIRLFIKKYEQLYSTEFQAANITHIQ